LLAGWNAARLHQGFKPLQLPETTMLGALCHYVTHASPTDFQPMKANFGILPGLKENIHGKRPRAAAHVLRAMEDLDRFMSSL
jgi:methylenetetrahydrofolate--tRNA-(uracil-5-)-methyltransferase